MLIKAGSARSVVVDTGLSVPSTYYVVNSGGATPGAGSLTPAAIAAGASNAALVNLSGSETGTAGDLLVVVFDSGGVYLASTHCQVVTWDPEDNNSLGLSHLDVAVSTRGTANPGAAMDLIPGVISAVSAAAAAAVLTLANGVDTGCTVADALKTMVAVLTGKEDTVAGVSSFLNWAETKTRVQTTASAGGNRTAPTLDLS